MDTDYNDHSTYPFIALLEQNAAQIAAEGLALVADDFLPMPEEDHNQHNGAWVACPLALGQHEEDFPSEILARNRSRCPATMKVLDQIEGLVVGGFMAIKAGGRVLQHSDIRDDDVIQVHLAVRLPEEDKDDWSEGRARLIDVRLPYGAENTGDVDRLTLVCDVRMDFNIPDGVVTPWGPVKSEETSGEE